MTDRNEIWTLLDGLQMDLRTANAKLTTLRSIIAGMNLPAETQTKCPTCGLGFKGPNTLAEHQHTSHDGPVPQHWLAIEAKAADALPSDSRQA